MMMRIKSLFQRNLPAKIFALLVAIVLWFFVMNDQNPSIDGSFTVPLNVVNAPEGYKISRSDDTIKIKVRGPRSLFVSAAASEFKAYVSLDGVEEGRNSIKVQTVLPQGFELVEASPDVVTVTVEKIVQRQVKVDLIVTGASAQGTTVAKVEQNVSSVTVEGPKSSVDEVARVIGYVGLSGNKEDFNISVPLTAVNSDGREVEDVRVTPKSAEASVQLARGLSKKVVEIKPVFSGELPAGYVLDRVRIDPSKIEIAGASTILDSLTAIDTEKIQLATETKSFHKEVQLELPEGVTKKKKKVNVNIDIAEKK